MRKIKRIPITREGYEKLKIDLEKLKSSRPDAVNTLSEARKLGDLSENGLYTAAKMRLRGIDSQIFRISTQIKLAEIIEKNKGERINLGSEIILSTEKGDRNFKIVGEYEADPQNGRISSNSPLGKKLLGKKKGEEIAVNAPSGKIVYKVKEII